jgi:hypothetical protein
MDASFLLSAAGRCWEHLHAAWCFYLVVAAAVVGAVVLVPRLRADRPALRLLAVGFALFAWTHLLGLLYILKQWAALAAELRLRLPADAAGRLAGAGFVEAPEPVWVVPFHLLGDAFVLFALWRLSSRPQG